MTEKTLEAEAEYLTGFTRLPGLLKKILDCQVCEAHLPFAPKPILRASATSSLLIVGQAPGRRVHETGIPWNDPSGDRLRQWLKMTREEFYDETRIAIIPTGFCYPGKGKGGDLPPRPECAPLWHPPLRKALPGIKLTLLIGSHAQAWYLKDHGKSSMVETVRAFCDYLPEYFPLPHPSPRNLNWFRKNLWFEKRVVPELRKAVRIALASGFQS